MDDEAPASLPNADKDPTALDPPSPKRPDGPVLPEKESSTLAPGQDGSAMSPEAPSSGPSFDAVEDPPSPGGNDALASSTLDGPVASSEKPLEEGNLEAPEETYRWRGGLDGYGFLVNFFIPSVSEFASGFDSGFFSFDNVKHS
jgi:hypothetical protein